MLDLPYATYRALTELLTRETHVKTMLILYKIRNSGKNALAMLMETAMMDVRSVTGHNFMNIMLLVGKTSEADVRKSDLVSTEELIDNLLHLCAE